MLKKRHLFRRMVIYLSREKSAAEAEEKHVLKVCASYHLCRGEMAVPLRPRLIDMSKACRQSMYVVIGIALMVCRAHQSAGMRECLGHHLARLEMLVKRPKRRYFY